jgi:hypothetical protein
VVHVPASLYVPSDDVFLFLYRQFPMRGSRAVPAGLRDYLRRKEDRHGPDRVWTYSARAHLGSQSDYRRAAVFFLSLTLSGCAWVAWGSARAQGGWIAAGVGCVFFGGLFALLFWLQSRRPPGVLNLKRWQQSGLVVSPDGLAMVQGDMSGQLRWEEVVEVQMRKRPGAFQYSSGGALGGILLKVQGATIVIADVYDRPLSVIYQQIRYYWQGEPAGDEDRAWDAGQPPRLRPDSRDAPPFEGIVPPE